MTTLARLPAALLIFGALSTTVVTTGCANRQYASPQEAAANACHALGPKALSGSLIGGLGGAGLGAASGAAFGGGKGAAIGAGVGLLGGLIAGAMVGSQADARDCAAAQAALAQLTTAPNGREIAWSSPSGSHGSYTPVGPEYASNGGFCRPVHQETSIVGHQPTQGLGVACRDANGDYQRMNTETAAAG